MKKRSELIENETINSCDICHQLDLY